MMGTLFWIVAILLGAGCIVWRAETFARHLAAASTRLGVSAFALALLLAGAEPEELATAVAASIRKAPALALGDVIGANVTTFRTKVLRYALLGLPLGATGTGFAWDGLVSSVEDATLVLLYRGYVAMVRVIEKKAAIAR